MSYITIQTRETIDKIKSWKLVYHYLDRTKYGSMPFEADIFVDADGIPSLSKAKYDNFLCRGPWFSDVWNHEKEIIVKILEWFKRNEPETRIPEVYPEEWKAFTKTE